KQHDATRLITCPRSEGCVTLKKSRLLQASDGTRRGRADFAGTRTMAKAASSPMLQLIRHVIDDQRGRQLSDQDLLRQFKDHGDAVAFDILLRRHGPMVRDVCRGVVANEADAEDAFQATFLILARKAASIRKAPSLGSWLHGVAHRTALKARAEF